jgi:1,2-diacylglycerol 3-beta-galactosyltransferase
MYKASAFPPTRFFFNSMQRLLAFSGIRACLDEYQPDLIISMHPLCQTVPLQALAAVGRDRDAATAAAVAAAAAATARPAEVPAPTAAAEAAAAELRGGRGTAAPRVPFVTVVTDLGAAHPLWLHRGVDLCFVPSTSFVRAAKCKGLCDAQLRLHGLPVRQDFAEVRRRGAAARRGLGLLPDRRTVLIVGGGDGVGKLGAIVQAVGDRLSRSQQPSQVVVVCGRNKRLLRQLQEQRWPENVHVHVEGFVTRMSEFMAAADCIVTKAGPGTIAEASICGLPVMLSGHLPGQETGNVKHVLANGFGAYSRNPRVIARTVATWLDDPVCLELLSANARAAARPSAAHQIVRDVVELLDGTEADVAGYRWGGTGHETGMGALGGGGVRRAPAGRKRVFRLGSRGRRPDPPVLAV